MLQEDINKEIVELKELPRRTINGCWYVELGSVENISRLSLLRIAKKTADSMNVEKKEEQFGVGDESMYNFGWNECLSKIEKQKEEHFNNL